MSAPAEARTDGPRATEQAGAALAAELRAGDVVLVSGELGAGKTTFVRGALRALGVSEPVTSPTFVIGHLYEGGFAHLDLYRLEGAEGEDPGLLDPYFGPELITFVEWPEMGGPLAELADRAGGGERIRRVSLAHAGGDERTVAVA